MCLRKKKFDLKEFTSGAMNYISPYLFLILKCIPIKHLAITCKHVNTTFTGQVFNFCIIYEKHLSSYTLLLVSTSGFIFR